MGNSEGQYALRRGSVSTLQRGSTYFLQGLSPQRVHSKGVLSPKSSHKCYFSTIHPLAMKGQTLLFTFQSRIQSVQSVRRFGAISFGVLAYFTISHPLPNHCLAQQRIGQRGRSPSRYGGESQTVSLVASRLHLWMRQ